MFAVLTVLLQFVFPALDVFGLWAPVFWDLLSRLLTLNTQSPEHILIFIDFHPSSLESGPGCCIASSGSFSAYHSSPGREWEKEKVIVVLVLRHRDANIAPTNAKLCEHGLKSNLELLASL